MEEILQAVMTRLQEQVPSLRWIDLNIGQMDLESPPVDYPCALIDTPSIEYSTYGYHVQTGEVKLEIELYFQVQTPSNMSMSVDVREEAFEHFKIANSVYKALEGFSGENFQNVNRLRMRRNTKVAPRGITIEFTCTVIDQTAVIEQAPVYASIGIIQ